MRIHTRPLESFFLFVFDRVRGGVSKGTSFPQVVFSMGCLHSLIFRQSQMYQHLQHTTSTTEEDAAPTLVLTPEQQRMINDKHKLQEISRLLEQDFENKDADALARHRKIHDEYIDTHGRVIYDHPLFTPGAIPNLDRPDVAGPASRVFPDLPATPVHAIGRQPAQPPSAPKQRKSAHRVPISS